MTPGETNARRRVVITMDTGEVDRGELERLTRLAQRLGAELEGVFVEDSDLFRLTELAFLQEFRPTSMRTERFQTLRMERELRAVARRAERALAVHAQQCGVPCRFRVWRGSIERELLAAMEADVLALMRLGAVLEQPARRGRAEVITALFDGSAEAARALETAADLAGDSDHVGLQVLLTPDPGMDLGALRREAENLLSDYPADVAYRSLEAAELPELINTLRDSGSSVLVMQRDNRLLRDTPLRSYLGRLHCPLILVR